MARREELEREIEELETRLEPGARAIDELSTIRRGLARSGRRTAAIELSNVRIGFACKQRWEDMVGDDRVRACAGCDRPVFNLSAMTRAEAEAVLATRGLTPCVRFYRRSDGTVMTTDCPKGSRPRRHLAVVASSLAAAGSTLAGGASLARAEPPVESTEDASSAAEEPTDEPTDAAAHVPIKIDDEFINQGIPTPRLFTAEVGVMVMTKAERPAVEWSVWGRLGIGVASARPDSIARRVTPPTTTVESAATWEAAAAADVTFRIGDGDLRLGAWGEIRTTSGPVAGAELVLEGLSPHPYNSRIGGAGTLVLRAGGNARIVTAALGFGYVGAWPNADPWVRWARHIVGARVVASLNHAVDAPDDWSATLGLEVEPIGVVHALVARD